jgi:hypothetical protein
MDESLIMEIWDTFREYIPDKHKDTAANQYVDYLLGKDVEIGILEGFVGYDPHLDDAIKNVVNEANALDDNNDDEYFEEDEE